MCKTKHEADKHTKHEKKPDYDNDRAQTERKSQPNGNAKTDRGGKKDKKDVVVS